VASGEFGADIMSLIAAADRALYDAKAKGRNCVALADEEARASLDGRPATPQPGAAAAPAAAS
jgi:hypothetical protein